MYTPKTFLVVVLSSKIKHLLLHTHTVIDYSSVYVSSSNL